MRVGRNRLQAVDKIRLGSYPHFDHSFRDDLNTRWKIGKPMKNKKK